MARKQDRKALDYAQSMGYRRGARYRTADLGSDFAEHLEHNLALYQGVTLGWLQFKCGCSETIYVAPS